MTAVTFDDDAIHWVRDARYQAQKKILRLAENVGPTFLHATKAGRYTAEPAWWWTSGFWPGLLRLALEDSGDKKLDELALTAEDRLFDVFQSDDFFELHHDLGFQFQPTAVMRYKQTGNPTAKRRALIAAQLLMGRFNPASGIIEAWNGEDNRGTSIIDTMMNLPLLFWASEVTGEPRFANVARAHLATAISAFVRADHTTYHVVRFHQTSGKKLETRGGQGFASESAWSRGQAWAIYGLALASRYTGDDSFRAVSRDIADRFLDMNAQHGVPPWDFRADDAATAARDSSASAIAACGLLELSALGDQAARNQAEDLLRSLIDHSAAFQDDNEDGLLKNATASLPANFAVNVSLIYGDYFFYEALNRLDGGTTCW